MADFDRKDGQTGSGVSYEVHTKDGWLGVVTHVDDSDGGFAGHDEQPIDGIRAYRDDKAPLKITAHMTNGNWCGTTTFTDSMQGQNPSNDGYAGDIDSGFFIDGIKVEGAQIRAAVANKPYFGWLANGKTPEGDDFVGEDLSKKAPLVAVQMRA